MVPTFIRELAGLRRTMKRALYAVLPPPVQELSERYYYYLLLRFGLGDLSGETEFELLPLLVHEGETAVDVGANIGVYTLRLSELVGSSGRVHSFEPAPRTFRILSNNVRRLARHRNVTLHRVAVSDVRGAAPLYIPLEGSVGGCYYASLGEDRDAPSRRVEVDTLPLDEWIGTVRDRIAFMKIDTEGAELNVLRGAAWTLREHRPTILCEIARWIRRFGHAPREVFRELEPLGYEAFVYRSGELHRVHAPDDDLRVNYLFLQADVRERLRGAITFGPAVL